MLIRPRTGADVAACAEIFTRTQALDGYPRYVEHADASFVTSPAELGAWVAVDEGEDPGPRDGEPGEGAGAGPAGPAADRVLGHVALHHAEGDPCFPPAHAATGLPADALAVLARLAVDPETRGRGVGAALVAHVEQVARLLGRRLVLDVTTDALGAQRLYERSGWQRIGRTIIPVADLGDLDAYVYLAPER